MKNMREWKCIGGKGITRRERKFQRKIEDTNCYIYKIGQSYRKTRHQSKTQILKFYGSDWNLINITHPLQVWRSIIDIFLEFSCSLRGKLILR